MLRHPLDSGRQPVGGVLAGKSRIMITTVFDHMLWFREKNWNAGIGVHCFETEYTYKITVGQGDWEITTRWGSDVCAWGKCMVCLPSAGCSLIIFSPPASYFQTKIKVNSIEFIGVRPYMFDAGTNSFRHFPMINWT